MKKYSTYADAFEAMMAAKAGKFQSDKYEIRQLDLVFVLIPVA